MDAQGRRAYFAGIGFACLVPLVAGSGNISFYLDPDTGHVGIGLTGGIGTGGGMSIGPNVGVGHDGNTDVKTGLQKGRAVGMTVVAGTAEMYIDEDGKPTGGGGYVGTPGGGAYIERRGTVMLDLSQALSDLWDGAKGRFGY
ncbi:hypothetical protein BH11ARM2_BH11ARM2_02580 [soil metagenome]